MSIPLVFYAVGRVSDWRLEHDVLGYTAHLCASFPDLPVDSQAAGGNWGQSDEVVVKARNGVVVAETERAIEEGCRKIMVTYGGLHMQVTIAKPSISR